MLEYLDIINKPIKFYKSSDNYRSVFKEITGYYYHENYHSDILCCVFRPMPASDSGLNLPPVPA